MNIQNMLIPKKKKGGGDGVALIATGSKKKVSPRLLLSLSTGYWPRFPRVLSTMKPDLALFNLASERVLTFFRSHLPPDVTAAHCHDYLLLSGFLPAGLLKSRLKGGLPVGFSPWQAPEEECHLPRPLDTQRPTGRFYEQPA